MLGAPVIVRLIGDLAARRVPLAALLLPDVRDADRCTRGMERRPLKKVLVGRDGRLRSIGSVAMPLAAVAGGVDAVGYLALFHLFVAHMSGNSVGFAANLARAQWREAGMRGLPVPCFVFGIIFGALAAELAARARSGHALARTLVFELAAVAALTVTGMVYAPRGFVGAPLGWRF